MLNIDKRLFLPFPKKKEERKDKKKVFCGDFSAD
jgi:hypothetical protein